jgi:hypothetical protein
MKTIIQPAPFCLASSSKNKVFEDEGSPHKSRLKDSSESMARRIMFLTSSYPAIDSKSSVTFEGNKGNKAIVCNATASLDDDIDDVDDSVSSTSDQSQMKLKK